MLGLFRRAKVGSARAKFSVRTITSAIEPYQAGFVFDMDGVLLRGKNTIEQAPSALGLLNDRKIPWIVMTNGGGISESKRAEVLSDKVGFQVDVDQIVQAHTPLKSLDNKENETVLVVGGDGDNVKKVAQDYGFGRVVISADFIKTNQSIWPFHNKELLEFGEPLKDLKSLKVDKVMIFNDSRDLGTDLQVIFDVFRTNPDHEVYFSNQDLYWANDFKYPRFGQGVIMKILQDLYVKIYNKPLPCHILGKPHKIAYDYAHHVLINRSSELHGPGKFSKSDVKLGQPVANSPMKSVFMVGDNIESDIIGGYDYGWNTALVRTGVYKDGDELKRKPTLISDNVYEAVKSALRSQSLL